MDELSNAQGSINSLRELLKDYSDKRFSEDFIENRRFTQDCIDNLSHSNDKACHMHNPKDLLQQTQIIQSKPDNCKFLLFKVTLFA